jgi:hypothetical protein
MRDILGMNLRLYVSKPYVSKPDRTIAV